MRPLRVEVEGFSAYRSRVEVDLSGVAISDLPFFSLSGATGAGKSSLVDAMIFALYGRIPRLGAREVAPAISAGTDRARVRLDFEVGGMAHTAVRLAVRTPNGATVKEARLERGDTVLASGADKVTAAVEELLRLGFEDFTRTVVLPQGDFARFLNATKAERQALLRGILGLEVYGRVRDLAIQRQAVATAKAEAAKGRLAGLDVPAPDDLAASKTRVEALETLARSVTEQEKELEAIAVEMSRAEEVVRRLEDAGLRLKRVNPPDDLEELGEMVRRAKEALADAEEAHSAATTANREVSDEIAGGPDPEVVAVQRRAHEELARIAADLETLDPAPAMAALEGAETRLADAKDTASAAQIRRDDLRVGHAAHALSRELVIGEPCPVCRHPVEAIHEPGEIPELDRAVSEVEAAIARVDAEQREVDSARAALTEVETTRSNLISRREQLAEGVAAGPDLDALAGMEETLEELRKRQTATREELEKTETKVKEARKTVEDLAGREHSMGRLLQTALIAVADLDPPVSESDDVVVQWKDLLVWRDGAMTRIADEQETAVAKAAETRSRHQGLRQGLIDELAGAGLTPAEPFVATIASEIERARSTLALQERVLEESAVLTVEIDTETSNAAVAAGLAT
ncbi:MAG: SMC family ATPase, partial [Actinobacteria bacterium]|nr:SMC family ATPase [Actinomycetota bacterium]